MYQSRYCLQVRSKTSGHIRLQKPRKIIRLQNLKLKFPQSLGELNGFLNSLNGLEQLVAFNESEAVELTGLLNQSRKYSTFHNYNCSSNESYGLGLSIKPTYYTPPSGKKAESIIPYDIYAYSRRRLFTEKIVIGESNPEVPEVKKKGSEDMFGWCELNNGNWYNSVTGVTTEISPYQ